MLSGTSCQGLCGVWAGTEGQPKRLELLTLWSLVRMSRYGLCRRHYGGGRNFRGNGPHVDSTLAHRTVRRCRGQHVTVMLLLEKDGKEFYTFGHT